jgi:hypothetical protein
LGRARRCASHEARYTGSTIRDPRTRRRCA